MKPLCFCLAMAFLACSALRAERVSVHARNAVETIRELRKIGLPSSNRNDSDNSDLNPGPPPRVPGLLKELNRELKELIVEYLNDPSRNLLLKSQEQGDELIDRLAAAGWEEIPSHKWSAYGEIKDITFGGSETHPDLILVSTHLWVPCGDSDPDSALYVFRGSGRRWDLVLSADSDFDGGEPGGRMEYQVSQADSHGQWFLVLARVPPSCRHGAAPTISYEVLRPGASEDQPIILMRGRERISPFFEEPLRVDVDKYSFAVTYGIKRKLDAEPGIEIAKYSIAGDQVQRTPPLALTAEDFLDQWAQMSWDDAKRWIETRSVLDLEKWHAKLNGLAADSVEIDSVQPCATGEDDDHEWLIHVAVDQPPNPTVGTEDLYVGVSKREDVFFVTSVDTSHPSTCLGKTPPKVVLRDKMPEWWTAPLVSRILSPDQK